MDKVNRLVVAKGEGAGGGVGGGAGVSRCEAIGRGWEKQQGPTFMSYDKP